MCFEVMRPGEHERQRQQQGRAQRERRPPSKCISRLQRAPTDDQQRNRQQPEKQKLRVIEAKIKHEDQLPGGAAGWLGAGVLGLEFDGGSEGGAAALLMVSFSLPKYRLIIL